MALSKPMRYMNLIGGRWVESSTGKTFVSVNPADTSDVLGYFQEATVEEAQQAIEAAREFQPAWAEAAPAKRAEVLYRVSNLIEENTAALAELLTREEGKTLAEARKKGWTVKQQADLDLGEELTRSCFEMYNMTQTGIAPEIVKFNTDTTKNEDITIKPNDR